MCKVGVGPAMLVSLFLHFLLISVILFATDRVDALMVDHIMTSARFARVLTPLEAVEEEAEDEGETVQSWGYFEHVRPIGGDQSMLLTHRSGSRPIYYASDWISFVSVMTELSSDWETWDWAKVQEDWDRRHNWRWTWWKHRPQVMPCARCIFDSPSREPSSIKLAMPFVKPGKPEISGSLDRRLVQRVVQQHRAELRACYEREAAKVKGLSGKVDVSWIVAANGLVMSVGINESTIGNKNVENCVVNSIKHWRFPAPKGGGMVRIASYPFVFSEPLRPSGTPPKEGSLRCIFAISDTCE